MDGNRSDWYRLHRIIPDDQGNFFVEDCRDLATVSQEIECVHGFSVPLRAVSGEDFALLWMEPGIKSAESIDTMQPIERWTEEMPSPSRLLDNLLEKAVAEGASDVHFEISRESMAVRMRADGELRTIHTVPAEIGRVLSVQLKFLANLSIAEHFRPQDGRFSQKMAAGHTIDFRISILPTKFGESIVLRVLDRRKLLATFEELGMPRELAGEVRKIISARSGLFLAVGPTGSGKTTTLYAALEELRGKNLKILTVEDPVEYAIDGVLQVPVNPPIGRTFALSLRALLRHDPNVIFIGEIRDGETAEIALRAALTGHLVLSSLHTATADEAILRLEELGLDHALLAGCLRGILAQRLLRLNCPLCSKPLGAEEIFKLPEFLRLRHPDRFRAGIGCSNCAGTGNRGRLAIFSLKRADGETSLFEESLRLLEGGRIGPVEFNRQIPWEH